MMDHCHSPHSKLVYSVNSVTVFVLRETVNQNPGNGGGGGGVQPSSAVTQLRSSCPSLMTIFHHNFKIKRTCISLKNTSKCRQHRDMNGFICPPCVF